MDKALVMSIKGIKCDHCDYKDMDVNVEDYPQWLNKPCPVCGHNLLTQADFDNVQMLLELTNVMNQIFPAPGPNEQIVKMSVDMDGSGKMNFGEIVPIDNNNDDSFNQNCSGCDSAPCSSYTDGNCTDCNKRTKKCAKCCLHCEINCEDRCLE